MYDKLVTPALVLDANRLETNCARMNARVANLGVRLRPHLKTCKSLDVARIAVPAGAGVCVSTLAEAAYFAEGGYRDIWYTVGLVPDKVAALADVSRRFGAIVTGVIDNGDAIAPLGEAAAAAGHRLPLIIELDVDGYRAGMPADPANIAAAARAIAAHPSLAFCGLMAFPGATYTPDKATAARLVEGHRSALQTCRDAVRAAGIDACITSIGATPGTLAASGLEGLDETRAGVYMFMDLAQVNYGTCALGDLAVSVLASIVSVQAQRGRIVIDAGGLALSQDRSTAGEARDFGYGLVVLPGQSIEEATLIVERVSQEHGIVRDPDDRIDLARLRIGDRVRVYPNHVCMTAAAYDRYHVLRDGQPAGCWPRRNGWS